MQKNGNPVGTSTAARPTAVRNAVEIAHKLCALKIKPGDTVIDCTMGNGNDTVLLCRLAGAAGKVYAFDIQERALAATGQRLEDLGLRAAAELILDGHQHIDKYVTDKADLIIFNLGYLPGGDHELTTLEDATLEAVRKSLALLKPGGLILIVVYPGHESGRREKEALAEMTSRLDQKEYQVILVNFTNQASFPPELICIEKL